MHLARFAALAPSAPRTWPSNTTTCVRMLRRGKGVASNPRTARLYASEVAGLSRGASAARRASSARGQAGLAVLAQVRDAPTDLVTLDVMLPGLDGLEVCRRLRAVVGIPLAATLNEDSLKEH